MRWPLLALVCVLLLAGCGDVDSTATPTPTVESNATEAPTPSTTDGPNATTDTPGATTPTAAGDQTSTQTATEPPATGTPVAASVATATPTISATPTPTATATSTATATPTSSPTPTATPTSTPTATGPDQRSSWTVEVIRVIDGDTMEVRMPDGSEDTIRLLGVDTPETSASQTSPDEWEGIPDNSDGREWLTTWGNDATAYAEERLGGEEIYIETDAESDRRGTYDRLLVYASQSDSADTSFNLRLIENGYARMYDTQFSQRSTYAAAESQAQDDNVGVWSYEESSTPAPDGGGQQSSSLAVSGIHADAGGNDHENLNDEYVEFTNDGESAIDMTGWTLSDQADHTYQFPSGFTLAAGDSVTVYTGSGSDTEDELYWGSGQAVWNNGGDTIYVRNDGGETVIEHVYG